jgi:hypothetical protein
MAAALVAVAVLLTPVTYRAGAEIGHPHALVQLVYEATRGVPDHHHPSSDHLSDVNHPISESHRRAPDVAHGPDGTVVITLALFAVLAPIRASLLLNPARRDFWCRREVPLAGVKPGLDPPPPRVA